MKYKLETRGVNYEITDINNFFNFAVFNLYSV